MADIKVLIVVDGIFSLTTTYPIDPTVAPFGPESNPNFGPDAWFTLSHLINTLRNNASPTFAVDTASRGFNAAGAFPGSITNSTPDPDATISTSAPFRFDDPIVNLHDYDEIWLFGDEGNDDGAPVGPTIADPTVGPAEPGSLTFSELAKLTEFMDAGGGLFAVGDHSGLGAGLSGFIPRLRYMRKWFDGGDSTTGLPPLTVRNWPGGTSSRVDTLQQGATDAGSTFFFDDQSDDIPQPLSVLVPSHPAVQGATGVLSVYPDHMHEGEVMAPSGAQLTQTSASDSTLSFAGPGFTEFPSISGYQEVPIVLAQSSAGTSAAFGGGPSLSGHVTEVPPGAPEDKPCENLNFGADTTTCSVRTNNTLAAYDGHTVNVGRIATDSSFHHFLDLNLLGDPCSLIPAKRQGFNASAAGKAHLKEIDAFYVNLASWLAWIDKKFYFVIEKNNYGRDEVTDNPSYPGAFYLFLEGLTPNVVGSSIPSFSGNFSSASIPGLTISGPTITYDVGNTGADANVIQRIRFECEIQFTSASLGVFPSPGDAPKGFTLDASINIQGKPLPLAAAEFFLLGGDDPYFANINDKARNLPYLSQELRVFTITPTADHQTFYNATFNFTTGSPTLLDTAAGYTYIQDLITYLNKHYGYLNPAFTPPDTNSLDPLNTLLPDQAGALNGDSSVTPQTGSNINYNYAIARVRLKGTAASLPASSVKVFFRIFTTQTFDTDFISSAADATTADPNVTYPPSGTNPASPLPGTDSSGNINGCSLPMYATGNGGPNDYSGTAANDQTIALPGGQDYTWAFFGCFLNVNDVNNEFGDAASPYGRHPIQHWLAGSAHNCLVAQIAFKDAPIENVNGVIENPALSDKLAQRNLQVTTSGNPGFPATHRAPQTIDVRPSPPTQSTDRRSILSYPDEMMIDWGRTPHGAVASIYWPEVNVASVLQLAKQLYPAQTLNAANAHTIQFKVASPVTYVPIPAGSGGSFAGLLTIELPNSVGYGAEFDVLVRRITTKQLIRLDGNQPVVRVTARGAGDAERSQLVWRYISGSFLAKLSVQRESKILPADENLLAILKWRLGLIGPSNRWYLVLLLWIKYLSGRISGMGGDPGQIPPSPHGYQPPPYDHPTGEPHRHFYTGKVIGIRYDRFGDFEGFMLLTTEGYEHSFRGREPRIEELVHRAWMERTLVTVSVEPHDHAWPVEIVLRRWK
jgi:hypothetical protein